VTEQRKQSMELSHSHNSNSKLILTISELESQYHVYKANLFLHQKRGVVDDVPCKKKQNRKEKHIQKQT